MKKLRQERHIFMSLLTELELASYRVLQIGRTDGAKQLQASGSFNFIPIAIRSVARPLAAFKALTVVPCTLAMRLKVSAGFTT